MHQAAAEALRRPAAERACPAQVLAADLSLLDRLTGQLGQAEQRLAQVLPDTSAGCSPACPATTREEAWISGGSPTRGFLSNLDVGPLQSFFHSVAGTVWGDWGFTLALFGVGLALVLGIGLRVLAVGGSLPVLDMWLLMAPRGSPPAKPQRRPTRSWTTTCCTR